MALRMSSQCLVDLDRYILVVGVFGCISSFRMHACVYICLRPCLGSLA